MRCMCCASRLDLPSTRLRKRWLALRHWQVLPVRRLAQQVQALSAWLQQQVLAWPVWRPLASLLA
ncbi:hypothetical protein ALQ20_200098 [Pseudomonas syringae pv. atrofaciens]|nr:hypothetical protein ALQ20_200098 [Pseudomonas syringae pv. atrofaciens]